MATRRKKERKIYEGGVVIRIIDVDGKNVLSEIEDEYGNIFDICLSPGSMISLSPPS